MFIVLGQFSLALTVQLACFIQTIGLHETKTKRLPTLKVVGIFVRKMDHFGGSIRSNMSFIILEGPDCTGKTTMAKKLVEKLSGFYYHFSWSKTLDTAIEEYHEAVVHNLLRSSNSRHGPFILDRSWVSEVIYRRIFRPEKKPYEYTPLQEKIVNRAKKVVYIYCCSYNPARYEKNIDGQHPYSLTDYVQIVNYYTWFFSSGNNEDDRYMKSLRRFPGEHILFYDMDVDPLNETADVFARIIPHLYAHNK